MMALPYYSMGPERLARLGSLTIAAGSAPEFLYPESTSDGHRDPRLRGSRRTDVPRGPGDGRGPGRGCGRDDGLRGALPRHLRRPPTGGDGITPENEEAMYEGKEAAPAFEGRLSPATP